MIQRIQSVFLLLSVLISGLLFMLPLFSLQNIADDAALAQEPINSFSIASNSFLLILNSAIGLLSLVAVFLYKKRTLQIRACNLNMILICVLVGLLFYTADTLSTSTQERVNYSFGTYLPLIQLVFTFLAMRAIKKDDELVRSASRLR